MANPPGSAVAPTTGVSAALAGMTPERTSLSQFSLQEKVALVTGAHRGIGLELSLALAQAGATVYCIDLPTTPDSNWLKVKAYCAALPPHPYLSTPGRLEYMHGDVTDQKAMWALAEEIVSKEGRLDVCVANAGIVDSMPCLEYETERFKKVLDVNVCGALHTAQAAGRQMEKLGNRGSIIMIASIAGYIASLDLMAMAYHSSKAAVQQLSRSMAVELASKGIRVNTISPGYIRTQLIQPLLSVAEIEAKLAKCCPLDQIGSPTDLTGAVLWLASSSSAFCTGSDIVIDGGQLAW